MVASIADAVDMAGAIVEHRVKTPRSATFAERYSTYALLAGQHLITLVTRVALPYLVAFICVDHGFSDNERATLLSSFGAGYVTMQVL